MRLITWGCGSSPWSRSFGRCPRRRSSRHPTDKRSCQGIGSVDNGESGCGLVKLSVGLGAASAAERWRAAAAAGWPASGGRPACRASSAAEPTRRLRCALDRPRARDDVSGHIGQGGAAASRPSRPRRDDRGPERPVEPIDEVPGPTVGHADRPAGRRNRAELSRQLEQLDLALPDGALIRPDRLGPSAWPRAVRVSLTVRSRRIGHAGHVAGLSGRRVRCSRSRDRASTRDQSLKEGTEHDEEPDRAGS